MGKVQEVLTKLKLQLHPEKTKIVNSKEEEFEFLGFRFVIHKRKLKVIPREKSIRKFKAAVKTLTYRKQPIKPEDMVGRLNWTIRGWGNYFRIGDVNNLYKGFDVWIIMRVRCFI